MRVQVEYRPSTPIHHAERRDVSAACGAPVGVAINRHGTVRRFAAITQKRDHITCAACRRVIDRRRS